jgi:hypothetical protein
VASAIQVASSPPHVKASAASAVWGREAGARRAPKALAKGGHGIKARTVDEFDSDDDEAASLGARDPAPPQALAASAVQVASSPAPRQNLGILGHLGPWSRRETGPQGALQGRARHQGQNSQ